MKTLTFIAALAIAAPALGQEPAPEEKPAPVEKADATAKDSAEAAKKESDQVAPDLPPLPEPAPGSEQADLLRTQPGGRLSPNPVAVPGGSKEKIPERLAGRTTLRPPATSEELEQRISYRNARTRAEADPKLRAIWDESRTVPTDAEKRELLKEYYKGLYTRMLGYDKSIAPLIEQRKRVALRRLTQRSIDPSIPLDDARLIGSE